MTINPYSSPNADLQQTATKVRMPRPISVWIMEAFLLLVTALLFAGTIGSLWVGIQYLGGKIDWTRLVFTLLILLAMGSIFYFSIRALHRGTPLARWLGLIVIVIVGLAASAIFGRDTVDYLNDAERFGANFARYLMFPLLFIWWGYAFAFSQKAKRYFTKR